MWTWIALDAGSKLIMSYLIGGRDADCTDEFMQDIAGHVANPVAAHHRWAQGLPEGR